MNDRTKAQALKALDGMAVIVKAEMTVRGHYITPEVINEDRVGAICGGHKACAVGSLWIGGGIKPVRESYRIGNSIHYGGAELPGVIEECREEFLRPRHGLRVAYDALNEAATAYAERNDLSHRVNKGFEAPIEQLFESGVSPDKKELLKIINSAKRKIRSA